jgi:RimJ/RimL family protein N-acetyltransferase
LRPLTKADVTERYLGWLSNPSTSRFIETASDISGLHALENYVIEHSNRLDILFLGIFDLISSEHIGNIKYEPIDLIKKYAVMGIMIGQSEWRGKGVALEVITETAKWLNDFLDIKNIFLGVDKENINGIKAYESCGFILTSTDKIKLDKSKSLAMMRSYEK